MPRHAWHPWLACCVPVAYMPRCLLQSRFGLSALPRAPRRHSAWQCLNFLGPLRMTATWSATPTQARSRVCCRVIRSLWESILHAATRFWQGMQSEACWAVSWREQRSLEWSFLQRVALALPSWKRLGPLLLSLRVGNQATSHYGCGNSGSASRTAVRRLCGKYRCLCVKASPLTPSSRVQPEKTHRLSGIDRF